MVAHFRLHLRQPVHRRHRVHRLHQQPGQVLLRRPQPPGPARGGAGHNRLPTRGGADRPRRPRLQHPRRPVPGHVPAAARRLQLRPDPVAGGLRLPGAPARPGQRGQSKRVTYPARSLAAGFDP